MLECERNTPDIRREIERAFNQFLGKKYPHHISFDVFFEHGQWFIHAEENRDGEYTSYSVVDCETTTGVFYFGFEELG